MNFGEAIAELKAGKKMACDSWNGKFTLELLHGNDLVFTEVETSNATHGWMASKHEILAEDWGVVL